MREQERHRLAFERYVAMGADRSLTRLAHEQRISESSAKQWSRAFRWAQRLAEREREVAHAVAERSTQENVEERLGQKKLVRLALVQIAQKVIAGEVRPSFGDMDRLIRLERDLEGEEKIDAQVEFVVVRDPLPRDVEEGEP